MVNERPVRGPRVVSERPASSRIFHKYTVMVEWDSSTGEWQATYLVSDSLKRTLPPGRGHFGRNRVHLGRFLHTRLQKIIGEYWVMNEEAPR